MRAGFLNCFYGAVGAGNPTLASTYLSYVRPTSEVIVSLMPFGQAYNFSSTTEDTGMDFMQLGLEMNREYRATSDKYVGGTEAGQRFVRIVRLTTPDRMLQIADIISHPGFSFRWVTDNVLEKIRHALSKTKARNQQALVVADKKTADSTLKKLKRAKVQVGGKFTDPAQLLSSAGRMTIDLSGISLVFLGDRDDNSAMPPTDLATWLSEIGLGAHIFIEDRSSSPSAGIISSDNIQPIPPLSVLEAPEIKELLDGTELR